MNTTTKLLLLHVAFAGSALAQTTVSGTVYDSVARAPLRGATVQIVPADNQTRPAQTTVSDSLGRFTFDGVAAGRYSIGFLHPMLDSLGIEPSSKEVSVAAARPLKVDLSIPSPARLRSAFCGDSVSAGGAIAGTVRDAAANTGIVGAKIEARWLEVTIRPGQTDRHFASRVATTNDNGWYRLCDVPKTGTVIVVVSRGADSTDAVEFQMPDGGFARGDLYLGRLSYLVRDEVLPDSTARDTMPRPSLRVGDGHLTGTVLTFPERRPLAQAHVRIVGGGEVQTNDRGEWSLTNIPTGTRTLEIRKIGYYPEQRVVNVVPSAPRIHVELATMKAMLDTIRIRAIRLYDPAAADFEKRRRTIGVGRFLTPADIEHAGGFNLSDALRNIQGLYVDKRLGDVEIKMRSFFSGGDYCTPAIFLDGSHIPGLTAGDIDGLVNRENVIGIEIYNGFGTPAQFQVPMSGCGSIVIWTDRTGLMSKQKASHRPASTLRTGLFFVGAALAIFLITR